MIYTYFYNNLTKELIPTFIIINNQISNLQIYFLSVQTVAYDISTPNIFLLQCAKCRIRHLILFVQIRVDSSTGYFFKHFSRVINDINVLCIFFQQNLTLGAVKG